MLVTVMIFWHYFQMSLQRNFWVFASVHVALSGIMMNTFSGIHSGY